MCQLYNLNPEDLFYKVEAFNYRPSATHSGIAPITLETLGALKAQIQRDMTKDSTKRAQTKPKPGNTAQVDRRRIPQNMVRNLPPTSIKQEATGETGVPGLSHLVFRGPSYDAGKKKSRACESIFCSALLMVLTFVIVVRPLYVREDLGTE
jgi:DNA polymerase alpha subunit B